MNQSIITARFYADTLGGTEYTMDCEENLGYRTPFRDVDLAQANAIFDQILRQRQQKRAAP